MGRVVVGLESKDDVPAVSEALRAAGAQHVSEPQPSLPDVVVAEFPDDDVEDNTLKSITALNGVRYAEHDQLRDAT
jgi:hypothetical protein